MDLSALPLSVEARRRIEAGVRNLSHAYIISGPEESGRETLAEMLAAAYVCTSPGDRPCLSCSNCRKVKANIHPDVIRINVAQGKQEITVDQVRKLRADAYVRPNEAQRKVFVIENAQAMNANAQNALLKILEDGPSYLAFVLLTEYPQQLFETIRSRCEQLSLTGESLESEEACSDPEQEQTARELAELLIGQDRRALAEYTCALERKKWSRELLQELLKQVEAHLCARLQENPGSIMPALLCLKQVQQALRFNIGTGHLLGWLAAGSQNTIGGTDHDRDHFRPV